jgi:4-hydroxy-L-threonine phosphate dehydrogenase PdxA
VGSLARGRVSLGIPIIRTSADHGTALDSAGKNKADPQNMIAAMKMGVAMAGKESARRPPISKQ